MLYLIAIPVAVLLYHSIHVLMEKYIGREPLWLKIYVVLAFLYIIATPVLFINYLSQLFHFSDATGAILMGITGLIFFLWVVNHLPSKKTKVGEWDQ